jgi:ADP-ribose pyrophosphatase YjhB (NUDIX family)
MMKANTQKHAYVHVNPVIITADGKMVLGKRREGIVGGRKKWHLLGRRVQFKETIKTTLKRVAFAKTNLKIELSIPP